MLGSDSLVSSRFFRFNCCDGIYYAIVIVLQFQLHLEILDCNTNISYSLITFLVFWCHMYNFRNVKNIHRRVLLLVKFQAEASNFSKSNTPTWVFFTFFKWYKCYQIAQHITVLQSTKYNMFIRSLRFN